MRKKNSEKKDSDQNPKNEINLEIAVTAYSAQPENSFELINKYGTYEIQPTADTDNQYPAIAQGFNKAIIKNDCVRKSADDYTEFKE